METGLKTFQTNNNLDNKLQNKLSIQVSLSGLSFCVLNKPSNTVLYHSEIIFKKILPPAEVLKQLKAHLSSDKLFQQDFNDVILIHDNALAALVPKTLFNKDNLSDYLKFNSKILNNDFITFDELTQNEIINVYVPYVNINNFIFDTYGTFEYNHYSTLLINILFEIHNGVTNPCMYVNIRSSHFEIVILKNKELILFNSFEYKTEEDFVYYILFTAEQILLDPETFPLMLMGKINKNDALYNAAYTYVRKVSVYNQEPKFILKHEDKESFIQNFVLQNSL